VFELVEQIERDFAAELGPGEFDRLRATLRLLADRIDPIGAFGAEDEAASRPKRRKP
jgi:hypothetical protein